MLIDNAERKVIGTALALMGLFVFSLLYARNKYHHYPLKKITCCLLVTWVQWGC